jgi:large subunit ribosomal protein L13
MASYYQTALAYARVWHHVNAEDRVLGRLAQRIAIVLMGKHKPIYDSGGKILLSMTIQDLSSMYLLVDCGDYVTVSNARKVVATGRKPEQKLYRHHTMWPGGLKEIPYNKMMERKPDEVCGLNVYDQRTLNIIPR